MSPTFLTTNDGDIILRAGTDPDSTHDFVVHKTVLSLASPVFKDMFAFPQPPNQALLPFVNLPDPPNVLDVILRFIYPGVEPPKHIDKPTLLASFLSADKYGITSIYPALKDVLKRYLQHDPIWVYIVASRFGFSEMVKEAAALSTAQSFTYFYDHDDLHHISSTDLFRLIQFVQERDRDGQFTIHTTLDPTLLDDVSCKHSGEDAKAYYFQLEKAVQNTFTNNPCVDSKDLFAVLNTIPDPPNGCKPQARSGEWYYSVGDDFDDAFDCPLRPMTIRKDLKEIADTLDAGNEKMLVRFFGKGTRSG